MDLILPCNYGTKIGMWFSPTTQWLIKDIIPSTYFGSGQGRIMGKLLLLLAKSLPQQWLHLQPLAPASEEELQPQVHVARTGLHPACSGPAAYGPAQPSVQLELTPCQSLWASSYVLFPGGLLVWSKHKTQRQCACPATTELLKHHTSNVVSTSFLKGIKATHAAVCLCRC